MKIILENISRRFNRDWIFRNINYTFQTGQSYAVLGANGSGKSTLLQIISGSLSPSSGNILYQCDAKSLEIEKVTEHISMAAPYMELIEELTLEEQVNFHFKFKNYRNGLNADQVLELSGLQNSRYKTIRYFSSGMKQRTKLALAFCADTPVLLLDEPASNLDTGGILWYQELIKQFADKCLLIICSNQEHEYGFCKNFINVHDFKS